MNREEQIGLTVVGDARPRFERDKCIVGASVNNFAAKAVFNQATKAPCDIEHDVFFIETGGAMRADILASVAGIDYDSAEFQPQNASKRTVAIGVTFGRLSADAGYRFPGFQLRHC